MFKKLLPLLFLFAGFQANAAIINQSSAGIAYNYDDATGLDWIDLTHTDGLSYNQITAQFTGWSVASESLWRDMYGYYDNTADDGKTYGNDTDYRGVVDGSEYASNYYGLNGESDEFFSDFGETWAHTSPRYGEGNSQVYSSAIGFMMNDTLDNVAGIAADNLRVGGVVLDHSVSEGVAAFFRVTNYYDYNGEFGQFISSPDLVNHNVGWYLIREHASVPEPSIIALFAVGLFGIRFARRRQS
jgi:hypothetical protein